MDKRTRNNGKLTSLIVGPWAGVGIGVCISMLSTACDRSRPGKGDFGGADTPRIDPNPKICHELLFDMPPEISAKGVNAVDVETPGRGATDKPVVISLRNDQAVNIVMKLQSLPRFNTQDIEKPGEDGDLSEPSYQWNLKAELKDGRKCEIMCNRIVTSAGRVLSVLGTQQNPLIEWIEMDPGLLLDHLLNPAIMRAN